MILVYSLIHQLIALASASIEDTFDYRSSLRLLDGKYASIPTALDVLHALMGLAPTTPFCVIDGVQILGGKFKKYLHRLLDILCVEDDSRCVKVLITTCGYFDVGGKIKGSERLDLHGRPKNWPGRPKIGGRPLSRITSLTPKSSESDLKLLRFFSIEIEPAVGNKLKWLVTCLSIAY